MTAKRAAHVVVTKKLGRSSKGIVRTRSAYPKKCKGKTYLLCGAKERAAWRLEGQLALERYVQSMKSDPRRAEASRPVRRSVWKRGKRKDSRD